MHDMGQSGTAVSRPAAAQPSSPPLKKKVAGPPDRGYRKCTQVGNESSPSKDRRGRKKDRERVVTGSQDKLRLRIKVTKSPAR